MPARERADAHRQEHVAELRHGRVREHALDVVLDEADRAGHERRGRADRPRRSSSVSGAWLNSTRVAPDHVHAGGHHRRRMDQRGDRRRAFHRVGQPDVERNLRRLAGGADEQQQRDERQRAEGVSGAQRRRPARDVLEIERAEVVRTAAARRG